MLQIRCKNINVTKSFPEGVSLLDVYQEFADEVHLPYPVVSARVNNTSQGLKFRLFQNRDVEFLDAREGSGHRVYVRSLSFVLYKATQDVFPGSKLFIEHSLCRGYYCNFKPTPNPSRREGRKITDEDVEKIRQRMQEIIALDMPFRRTEATNEEAIRVFAENLRQLLLGAPLGQKRVMGVDPGFRTGCKVVCLDAQGNLLHHEAIFPHPPINKRTESAVAVLKMIQKYQIEAISIGNGTASRETNDFIKDVLAGRYNINAKNNAETPTPQVFTVSEDGASVYSASKIARDEFPNEDVTVRGAVSIGRRLMDPLAELVKIDPKSIGVGQYQHDVDQTKLKHSLDQTVESCVNLVGVNLNTASQHLLMYVSGLGPTLAKNIVDFRKGNGAFTSRAQLKKVPRLGPSAYQQCAGFLRIPGAKNPLDNSAVHPESYAIVEQMAKDQGCSVADLINNKEKREAIDIHRYVTTEVGIPTLTDIMKELEKPGRDPREQLEEFEFDKNVNTIDDLVEGMILPGIVTNITNFGAFVDIGVHQDGLIHISQMANRRIAHPTDVVKLHQHLKVRVIEVDRRRKRISLSLKGI